MICAASSLELDNYPYLDRTNPTEKGGQQLHQKRSHKKSHHTNFRTNSSREISKHEHTNFTTKSPLNMQQNIQDL